jgi:hypothetical protein
VPTNLSVLIPSGKKVQIVGNAGGDGAASTLAYEGIAVALVDGAYLA